jgi:hypothetical protein
MLSAISRDVGTLFIQRAKRYVRFEVDVTSDLESQDVENYGIVLLVEVAVESPVPTVISKTAKKILSRLPSWTKAFEDSVDDATPDLQEPQTVAGKFINALVSDFPENFEKQVNLFELNRFIGTADESQLAWIYVTNDVPASAISIRGDDVSLARLNSLGELYESLDTDYVYYYNPIDRQLFTVKLFKFLSIDTDIKQQVPTLRWNWFDEYGARVGLSRLYLEENSSFKKRIMDVYVNKPGPGKESIQKTLRRELNLWEAFGATPDSNYLGATPEIIEISDIESSSPFFDFAGRPQKEFKKFVKDINEKYPVNWGYVKWDEGFWDYAGREQKGVGRVSALYDDFTPLGNYYQPGVGDFDDAKLIVKEAFENEVDFNARLKASGHYISGYIENYAPVRVDYEYYGSYYLDYYDNQHATVQYKYEVHLPDEASPYFITQYAYPKNSYGPESDASPEYSIIPIFDADGYSYEDYEFRNEQGDLYVDDSLSLPTNRLNVFKSDLVAVSVLGGSVDDSFNLKFFNSDVVISATPEFMDSASPYFPNGYNLQVSSNLYNKNRGIFTTDKIRRSVLVNSKNEQSASEYIVNKDFIHNTLVFEAGATPIYVHIDSVKPVEYVNYEDVYFSEEYEGYGGVSESLLIPASPNLNIRYINANFATPHFHDHFIIEDGGGFPSSAPSTVNYYFVETKYPYGSTPDSIEIFTNEDNKVLYPFQINEWSLFEEYSTPMISGTVSNKGIISSNPQNYDETYSKNTNLVGKYSVGYETFGLDPNLYFIEKIEVENATDGVELVSRQEFVTTLNLQSFYNNSIEESFETQLSEIEVEARYIGVYRSFINSGWYHQLENDYYIYSNPITETHATPGFSVLLSQVARQGAPIMVERVGSTPTTLTEVAFYNEDFPATPSLRNTEVIYANKGNGLYLGYENIYDVEVVDGVTGYTILSGATSSTNEIYPFSDASPKVENRLYNVSYTVKDSYVVNNDFYKSSPDSYVTKVDFDATPNDFYSYNITYESSINQTSTPISLIVDPFELWDDEGFVYLSHVDYDFATAKINLKPPYITNDNLDYMVLTINSLDVNSNSKPYQTFRISSSTVVPENEYVTTDVNGFAYVNISCPTSITSPSGTILIQGLADGNPEAHANSQTEGYSSSINFEIIPQNNTIYELKAAPDRYAVNADGVSQVYVNGILHEGSAPSSGSIVYWRKGRSLYDIFDTPYSEAGQTIVNQNGKFSIGPFTAQDEATPGIWLIALESEHAATPSLNPKTLSGDIVYWIEKYDNINYSSEYSVFSNTNLLYEDKVPIMATPVFTVNYNDGSQAIPYSATPTWKLPKWYPLDRFDQYQMGLLGSTPNFVATYENLMKDYEEE